MVEASRGDTGRRGQLKRKDQEGAGKRQMSNESSGGVEKIRDEIDKR